MVTKTKGHISDSGADPKGTLDAPKGTVPLGIGLARTLVNALPALTNTNSVENDYVGLTQAYMKHT